MKELSIHQIHELLGARFGEFAGWVLPMDYGSAIGEVNSVRSRAGIFDVSHMGRLSVRGPGALESLQTMLTNDVSILTDGAGQYTLMCNSHGGVIDDIIVYRVSENEYLLVVNAVNVNVDKKHIVDHLECGVELKDLNKDTILYALQGPNCGKILSDAGCPQADGVKRFHYSRCHIGGMEAEITRTGYTGEDGFEIIASVDVAEPLWNQLLASGRGHGLLPCGLVARDVLRIEAGLPLYGHEISASITPVEAGLMRWVKLDKGDFIGRTAISSALADGPLRRLMGIKMQGRAVPRAEDAVSTSFGTGVVTSGTFSPTLGCGIAMAYLHRDVDAGMPVEVMVHGKPQPGTAENLPLYRRTKL